MLSFMFFFVLYACCVEIFYTTFNYYSPFSYLFNCRYDCTCLRSRFGLYTINGNNAKIFRCNYINLISTFYLHSSSNTHWTSGVIHTYTHKYWYLISAERGSRSRTVPLKLELMVSRLIFLYLWLASNKICKLTSWIFIKTNIL